MGAEVLVTRLAWLTPLVLAACSTAGDGTDDTDTDTDLSVVETSDTAGDTSGPDTDTIEETDDTEDTDEPRQLISCKLVPEVGLWDACDLSVNNADATTGPNAGAPLLLDVRVSTNPPSLGGYNGTGRGNRAIAGFHHYNRVRIDALDPVSFDAEKVTGSLALELFVQVDLTCDGGPFTLLTVGGDDWPTPETVSGAVKRWTADPTASVWSAVSGLPDPDDPFSTDKLLYDAGDPNGEPRTLGAMLAVYPNACVRNFDAGFRDLPISPTAASGVILATGSSATWNLRGQWKVWRVAVQDDVHLPRP